MTQARIGRRAFLALSASTLLQSQTNVGSGGKGAASVFVPQRFLDPATEFDLYRLTDPATSARLSAPHLHSVSRRGRFLIHSSDRSGSVQAYRLDWQTGQSRQLTGASELDQATLALMPDDRSVLYFDGRSLKQMPLGNLRERTWTEVPPDWVRVPGFSVTTDASRAAWVERKSDRSRIRSIQFPRGEVSTVLESAGLMSDVQFRPGHSQLFYRRDGSIRVASLNGQNDLPMLTDSADIPGQARWSPDGHSILYLSIPAERTQLTTLREFEVEPRTSKLVAKTSQFVSFGANADASVFVGASRSLASPYLLLLLRSVRRELTLCEHRASDPAMVQPIFSPDSQNVFFNSDRRGKPCIYRAHVEKFVEETGETPDAP